MVFQKYLLHLIENGTQSIPDVVLKHRIRYFNAIILVLPIVYLVFVLMDVGAYLAPFSTWVFDQWAFFIFALVCLGCYLLNRIYQGSISKTLFLISWPCIMHIIPIVIQHTPSDYYYAFPMGLIFHSVMIQLVFCPRRHPFIFGLFLATNFGLTLYAIEFLYHFDTDEQSTLQQLAANPYYGYVIILYWLLFNMALFYLMHIVDHNLIRSHKARNTIMEQNEELSATLEKLKQSQQQLIHSEKLASLGVFTAGISHELNNPINYISTGAMGLFNILDSLRQSSLKDNPDFRDELKNMETVRRGIELGVEKASAIISSLRNYSHPGDAGFQEYNCANCIDDALLLLGGECKGRIHVIKDYPDEIFISGNAGKLNQLFFNLLNNAVQAIENKGEIRIRARRDEDTYIFEIQDSGCGIATDRLPNIFDPFYTTKGVGQGTGLGLYIVHSIVEEHEGRIDVESEVGQGSIFRIILPTNLPGRQA